MQYDDLMDAYLNKTLSNEERQDFEKKLASDQAFADSFILHKTVVESIKNAHRKEILADFAEWDKEIPQSKSSNNRNQRAWLLLAATVLLSVPFIYIFFFSYSSPQTLYAQYYETYPNYAVNITRGETATEVYEKAFFAYEKKNFQEATQLFEQYLATKKYTPEVALYYGLSNMELKDWDKAIASLKKGLDMPENDYQPSTQWYLALCYLQKENTTEAKILLKQLVENNNDYSEKANVLLNKLP